MGIKNQEIGFPIISYEFPKRLEEYLERHEYKRNLKSVLAKIRSDDTRSMIRKIQNARVAELRFRQIYHIRRRKYIDDCRGYFERNNLDVMLYPTMPMLPCKIKDYSSEHHWKVPHFSR